MKISATQSSYAQEAVRVKGIWSYLYILWESEVGKGFQVTR